MDRLFETTGFAKPGNNTALFNTLEYARKNNITAVINFVGTDNTVQGTIEELHIDEGWVLTRRVVANSERYTVVNLSNITSMELIG